jgi:8-oxo-dGTP pyrophosphatase MutT (NUDIX family)
MMDLTSITELARSLKHPNVRPRNAATLILVDRSGREPKVLMGKRHGSHAFMPGRFVFPGGRIEQADRDVPAAAELHPSVEARLARAVALRNARTARAFGLAAIRETFEETGIVIGRRHTGSTPPASGPWVGFFANGFAPDLLGLRFVARAITPPHAKRRFDARFLAADASAIAQQVDGIVHAGAELTEIVWVGISDALKLPLPDITELVLVDIAQSVAAGFAQDAPVPFYRMQHGRFTRELL